MPPSSWCVFLEDPTWTGSGPQAELSLPAPHSEGSRDSTCCVKEAGPTEGHPEAHATNTGITSERAWAERSFFPLSNSSPNFYLRDFELLRNACLRSVCIHVSRTNEAEAHPTAVLPFPPVVIRSCCELSGMSPPSLLSPRVRPIQRGSVRMCSENWYQLYVLRKCL